MLVLILRDGRCGNKWNECTVWYKEEEEEEGEGVVVNPVVVVEVEVEVAAAVKQYSTVQYSTLLVRSRTQYK